MPEIRDIIEPSEFIPEPTTPWWIWALAISVGLILITLIILLNQKNKPHKTRKTLLEKARSELSRLKKKSSELSTEKLATQISMVIRRYLEAAFEDPALFETNEEFTLRANALGTLHPDTRTQITDYLQQLSHFKYSPSKNTETIKDQAASLLTGAEDLLAHIELQP